MSTHYYCFAHDKYDCARCRKKMSKIKIPSDRRRTQDDGGVIEAITNKLYDGDYDGEIDYEAQETALIEFLLGQTMDEMLEDYTESETPDDPKKDT